MLHARGKECAAAFAISGGGSAARAYELPQRNEVNRAEEMRAVYKPCLWCSYASSRVSDLVEHMNTAHPKEYSANEIATKIAASDKESKRYKCFGCDLRFSQSGSLMDHMRQSHGEMYVKPGDQNKICPPQGGGSKSMSPKTSGSTCPHCHLDCLTRKKLMSHLEAMHKVEDEGDEELDDADDGEPRVKVIHLNGSSSAGQDLFERLSVAGVNRISPALGKLLKAIQPEDMGALVSPQQSTAPVTGSMRTASSLLSDVRVVALQSGGLRVSDRKYKCFWCNALFRKRGKLMDHIDTFHKDSKQQTEVEAELLNAGTTVMKKDVLAAENVGKNEQQRPAICHPNESDNADCQGASTKWHTSLPAVAAPRLHPAAAARVPCRFVMRTPTHRLMASESSAHGEAGGEESKGCKFYFRKLANPLAASRPQITSGTTASWPSSPFSPPCYFYAGSGRAPAPSHYNSSAQSIDFSYLLCSGARPTAPLQEDCRTRKPVGPSSNMTAAVAQSLQFDYARRRNAEEFPLDLSNRSKH